MGSEMCIRDRGVFLGVLDKKTRPPACPFFPSSAAGPGYPIHKKIPPGPFSDPPVGPFKRSIGGGARRGVSKNTQNQPYLDPQGAKPPIRGCFSRGFWTKKRGRLRTRFPELRSRPRLPHPQKNTPGAIFRPASWPFQAFNRRWGPTGGFQKHSKSAVLGPPRGQTPIRGCFSGGFGQKNAAACVPFFPSSAAGPGYPCLLYTSPSPRDS